MIKEIEAKGETIEVAIQNALNILGCDRDDVSVEVINKPKSGFLGFGKEPARVMVRFETSPADKAKDFLSGLLIRFGVSAHIEARTDEKEKVIHLELSGDNMGAIIGRRGDTLDALQYLTSIVTNREEDNRWRVTVDTENYRAKREASLISLANKTAQRALKYKKGVALEAMNPHERRIIHSALQDVEGVTTYSTGNEPNRKVIIAPADLPRRTGGRTDDRKTGGNRSGGNNNNRRRNNNNRKPSGGNRSGANGTSVEITHDN